MDECAACGGTIEAESEAEPKRSDRNSRPLYGVCRNCEARYVKSPFGWLRFQKAT